MKALLNILVFIIFACYTFSQPYGTGPIIGIVSIPSDVDIYPADQYSYFSSSYVKFVESGGAQVVPIQYDLPEETLVYLLKRVNGVLFTGGNSVFLNAQGNLTPIAKSLQFIVEFVLQENSNGNYYPLWGTCQGFQAIAMVLSNNFSLLGNCTGCEGVNKNNVFEPSYNSRLFAGLSDDLRQKMATNNLSSFAEHFNVQIESFLDNTLLSSIATPVTYTYDAAGIKYVSSYESPYYPIYATQFHQEKATFEWAAANPANHDYDAVSLQLYLIDFFVGETRKNPNTFPDSQKYLIDNYNVTVPPNASFTSIYLFPAISNDKKNEYYRHNNIII